MSASEALGHLITPSVVNAGRYLRSRTNDFSCETEYVPHRDQERLIDKSVTTSPAASDRTKPICGAYHLFSVPDSSSDHSRVRRQLVNVPAGTVTVSPTATIWPMSSA